MNVALLKKSNLFRVLYTIKCSGPMTKPEIATRTGLTSATVHTFVNELLGKNLLIEEGRNASNGGRKAQIYRFNSRIKYVIGVYLALHSITCCISDLDFDLKIEKIKPINLSEEDVQKNIHNLIDLINLSIAESGLSREDFAGIGIMVPGPANRKKGIILKLVNAHKWVNIPLKNIVEESIGLPVIVDKDDYGIALHYKWVTLDSLRPNVVLISITDGIGSGLLINGDVFRGSHYVAGEVGHMSVDPRGSICNCGNKGCLELYSSNAGIVRRVIEHIMKEKVKSPLKALYAEKGSLDIEDVVRAAREKDSLAGRIFTEASLYIAIALGNVIKMFDPDEIVLNCYWLEELPELFSTIVNHVYDNNHMVDRSDVKIRMNDIKQLLIKGAVTLQYNEIFGAYETCPFI
ncbi:serine/threonine protein kinase [Spirochaetia bacterium]|nr:serine/threonine protein kinase [Spirochaetia bacterium]